MKAFRFSDTAALLFASLLPMAADADKGFYRQDFSGPIPGFEALVMQRYDGNTKDSAWETDTYKHTGPFTFALTDLSLTIATQGYWEWDYCVVALPAPVRVRPDDSMALEARVVPGSGRDSARIGLQMGRSEKQADDGVLYPAPEAALVKTDWVRLAIAQKYGDDLVTHLFINIDAGYFTGPASGWWVEPNKPFSGTVEIRNLSLDGAMPEAVRTRELPLRRSPVRIEGSSIRYTGSGGDNRITVYDMAGRVVGAARNVFRFGGDLERGLYWYSISEGGSTIFRGRFHLAR